MKFTRHVEWWMDYNVGARERTARFAFGSVLLVVAIWALYAYFAELWTATQTTVAIVAATAMLLSGVLFVTGQTQKCPVNEAIGRNSYR
ncbi:YgaP family membrane protein [Halorarius litoreus]|uniref:YgaP family membrane protein n=1 Tax=Halorarius litoreus TaxID=2962676 RepID=UPI0020CE1395|nr:DUF2892 domain-containing protein [Halorarius litoreus]